MPLDVLHEVAESVALNTGAHRLIKALKHFGYTIAVFSGAFSTLVNICSSDWVLTIFMPTNWKW